MTKPKSELYFLLSLLIAIFVLTVFIFEPFLYPLVLSVVFATALEPIHRWILRKTHNKQTFSAMLSTLFVFVVLIVPVSFIAIQIFQEATGLYTSLATTSDSTEFSRHATETIRSLKVNLNIPQSTVVDIDQYLKNGLDVFIQNIGSLFTNTLRILIDTFIFLVALYYLFKDGKSIKNKIIELSPLSDEYDTMIFDKLEVATNSIVRGNLTVALIQGVLTSIGFLLFGIPSAVLWGLVTAIAALVPSVGTSLVIFPAIAYLFLLGKVASAIGLLVWGVLAVGLIDNVLGPKLVGRKVKLHSFLILLSILGGVSFFGPIGFLLGPLTLSFFLTLFEIYFTVTKKQESRKDM